MRCVVKVACDLDFPNEFELVNAVFHVSMFKRFVEDPTFIVILGGLEVKKNLSYEEVLVEMLER